MTNKKELELYIHIPFCIRKCLYCDFLSAPADEMTQQRYMNSLVREIQARATDFGDYIVVSVFIGGGTPSVVKAESIKAVMDAVRNHYCMSEDVEITLEMNPGTVDLEKLKSYKLCGINRLSIGLQSAEDAELKRIGRIHDWQQFLEAYSMATSVGFVNINVDVMSTLPGQSFDSYRNTLKKVIALDPKPKHISAYSLILEEGTELYDQVCKGIIEEPDEDLDRKMYAETKKRLEEAGYRRYEISNYAMPQYECRHNSGYWNRREYIGFGIGAASLIGNQRFQNGTDLEEYIRNSIGCRQEMHDLSIEEQMEEFMFLGLRMVDGISLNLFEKKFGVSVEEVYRKVIEKNCKDGLLEYAMGNRLRLTDKGLDLSNYVMAQFLIS